MFSLFKMFSVGHLTCAELDGKGLGNGVKRIEFCRDISGNPTNEIELRIDLDEFRFMPDGWYDDMYEKLVLGKEPEKPIKDRSTPLDEIKAAVKDAIETGRDPDAFLFIARLNRRTLFDEVIGKGDSL